MGMHQMRVEQTRRTSTATTHRETSKQDAQAQPQHTMKRANNGGTTLESEANKMHTATTHNATNKL